MIRRPRAWRTRPQQPTGGAKGTGSQQERTWNSSRYAHASQCSCASAQATPAQAKGLGRGHGIRGSTSGSRHIHHTKYCAVQTCEGGGRGGRGGRGEGACEWVWPESVKVQRALVQQHQGCKADGCAG